MLRSDGRLWAVDVESGGFAWTIPTVGLEGRLDGIVVSPDDQRFAVYAGPAVRLFSTLGAPLTSVATLSNDKASRPRAHVWFIDDGDLVVDVGARTLVRRATLSDTEIAAALPGLPLVVGNGDPRSSMGDLPTSRDRLNVQYTTSKALDW